jgi:hypothetical protein
MITAVAVTVGLKTAGAVTTVCGEGSYVREYNG